MDRGSRADRGRNGIAAQRMYPLQRSDRRRNFRKIASGGNGEDKGENGKDDGTDDGKNDDGGKDDGSSGGNNGDAGNVGRTATDAE